MGRDGENRGNKRAVHMIRVKQNREIGRGEGERVKEESVSP